MRQPLNPVRLTIAFLVILSLSNFLAKAETPEAISLYDLTTSNRISIYGVGNGIRFMDVTIENHTSQRLNLLIPAGTLFKTNSTDYQNMVSTGSTSIELSEKQTIKVSIPVACSEINKKVPHFSDAILYRLSTKFPNSQVETFFMHVPNIPLDWRVVQAALWILTDDADYIDMGLLQTLGGSRSIDRSTAILAMRAVDDSSIDITLKEIWRNRHQLTDYLDSDSQSRHDLRRWLAGIEERYESLTTIKRILSEIGVYKGTIDGHISPELEEIIKKDLGFTKSIYSTHNVRALLERAISEFHSHFNKLKIILAKSHESNFSTISAMKAFVESSILYASPEEVVNNFAREITEIINDNTDRYEKIMVNVGYMVDESLGPKDIMAELWYSGATETHDDNYNVSGSIPDILPKNLMSIASLLERKDILKEAEFLVFRIGVEFLSLNERAVNMEITNVVTGIAEKIDYDIEKLLILTPSRCSLGIIAKDGKLATKDFIWMMMFDTECIGKLDYLPVRAEYNMEVVDLTVGEHEISLKLKIGDGEYKSIDSLLATTVDVGSRINPNDLLGIVSRH